MAMKSREAVLARVWQNPPTSKRFIMRPHTDLPGGETYCAVWDQRDRTWIQPDEIERIDPDELMRLR